MTNQSELDEILNNYAKAYFEAKYESQLNTCDWAMAEAKQAILDWHNKQVLEILEKLHDENIQVAYVDGDKEYYEEYIQTDKLRMVITDYEMKINEAERNKLKESSDE